MSDDESRETEIKTDPRFQNRKRAKLASTNYDRGTHAALVKHCLECRLTSGRVVSGLIQAYLSGALPPGITQKIMLDASYRVTREIFLDHLHEALERRKEAARAENQSNPSKEVKKSLRGVKKANNDLTSNGQVERVENQTGDSCSTEDSLQKPSPLPSRSSEPSKKLSAMKSRESKALRARLLKQIQRMPEDGEDPDPARRSRRDRD